MHVRIERVLASVDAAGGRVVSPQVDDSKALVGPVIGSSAQHRQRGVESAVDGQLGWVGHATVPLASVHGCVASGAQHRADCGHVDCDATAADVGRAILLVDVMWQAAAQKRRATRRAILEGVVASEKRAARRQLVNVRSNWLAATRAEADAGVAEVVHESHD